MFTNIWLIFWFYIYIGKYTSPLNFMGSSEANRRIDLKLMRKEVFFGPNTFEVSISQMCCYFKDRMKDIAPKKNMSNKTPQQNIM